MDLEKVYLAGEWNILGDAPSRAPVDREVARNLPVPLGPIRRFVHRMFLAPEELAGRATLRGVASNVGEGKRGPSGHDNDVYRASS